MDDDSSMPARRRPSWAARCLAWLSTFRGPLQTGSDRESPEPEADDVAGEKAVEASITGNRVIECPECGALSFVSDLGVSMPGVGFCGHDWVFKMVKVRCVEGHVLDALDEAGSVHGPEECEHARSSAVPPDVP